LAKSVSSSRLSVGIGNQLVKLIQNSKIVSEQEVLIKGPVRGASVIVAGALKLQ
jgi:hypothetical protein